LGRVKKFPHFEMPVHRRTVLYILIRPWARWAIKLLFKVEGVQGAKNFPKKGAALLYANHQNGLIDPITACVLLGRQLHFFTRADVFRSRLGRCFLFGVNMMPVYRQQDRVKDLSARNHRTFQSAIDRLKLGAVLGIFPEGGHHQDRRLRKFRNGLARFLSIAIDQGLGTKENPVTVLPVNINFAGLYAYRSRVDITVQPGHKLRELVRQSGAKTNGKTEELSASHRVAITKSLKASLAATTPQLLQGELNPGHLAATLFLEGMGLREQQLRNAILKMGSAMEDANVEHADRRIVSQFVKLAESAGSPIESPVYEALGRLHGQGRTRLKTEDLLRTPFWLVHRVAVRPWIRLILKFSKRNVNEFAFVSTLGISLIMLTLPLLWAAISLAVALAISCTTAPDAAIGAMALHSLGIFALLRLSQGVAMPMEDRILHRNAENRANKLLAQSKFGSLWETWTRSVDLPRSADSQPL
jgi:hypothetical protein